MPYLTYDQVRETLETLRSAERSLPGKRNTKLRERVNTEMHTLDDAWLRHTGCSISVKGKRHLNGSFTFTITVGTGFVQRNKTLIWALADRKGKHGKLGDLVMSGASLLFLSPNSSSSSQGSTKKSRKTKSSSRKNAKK